MFKNKELQKMNTKSLKQKLQDAILPHCKLVSNLVIEEFAEKLSFDDLLTLTNLVTSKEAESVLCLSQCICIEIDSRNPQIRLKTPILSCIQMWRWPDFDNNRELVHKDSNSKSQRICINPYHYEFVEPEVNFKSISMTQLKDVVVEQVPSQYPQMQWWDETVPELKCRVCLSTDILSDWNAPVTEADQWISHEITYAECFYESTQLPPDCDEMEKKLPHFLCSICKTELRLAYIFICKARHADRMLRLKQEKSENNTLDDPMTVKKIESRFELVIAEKINQKDDLPSQTKPDATDLLDKLEASEADDHSNSSNALSFEKSEDSFAEEQDPQLSIVSNKTLSRSNRVRKIEKEGNPVVCEFCTKTFPKAKLLRAHVARVHKQPQFFLCHACPRTFRDTNTLRQHSLTHEPNRTREFTCNLCHSKFFTRSAFNTHSKTHDTNRKPLFDCDQCEKAFFHKGSLKLHKKIHTGENFACQICDKRYLRQIDLEQHMRTHSGHTPFKCHYAECDKAFNQVGLLNKHLRYHEGYRYKCDICAKEYNHQSTLAQHRKEHTGLPLKCALCDKGFVKRSKITRHIGGVHKVEDTVEIDKLIIRVQTKRECRIMTRKPKQSYMNSGQKTSLN